MMSSRHITSFDRPSCQDVGCFIYFGAADHLICKDQFLVHFSSLQYSLLEERSRGLPLWCEQLLQDMFYAGTIFAVASNQAERAEKTIVAEGRYMEMLSPEVCTSFSIYALKVCSPSP